jgi:hypothetical protein
VIWYCYQATHPIVWLLCNWVKAVGREMNAHPTLIKKKKVLAQLMVRGTDPIDDTVQNRKLEASVEKKVP